MFSSAAYLAWALASILVCWIVLVAIFTGMGLILHRIATPAAPTPEAFLILPWLGLSAALLLLQIWHLFLPADGWALLFLTLAAAIGWWWNSGAGLRFLFDRVRGEKAALGSGALLTVWLANRAMGPCNFGDTGLYHLSAVQWDNISKIVPGLVNLHGRLAFNNSIFLLHAMLRVGPWASRPGHLLNGLILAMAGAIVISGGVRVLHARGTRCVVGAFALLLSVILVRFAASPEVSSLSTDVPAVMLALIASWRTFALLLSRNRDAEARACDLPAIVVLLAAAVTVKLTVVFLAVPVTLLAFWLWRRQGSRWRPLLTTLAAAFLLISVWALRGYILSGYPAYPSELGKLPVSWAATADQIRFETTGISQFARTTQFDRAIGLTRWGWVNSWFTQIFLIRSFAESVMPAVLTLLGICAFLFSPARRRIYRGWILGATAIPALAIWFVVAPSPRMGTHLWWSLAATSVALGSTALSARVVPRQRRLFLAAVVCVAALAPFHLMALIQFRYRFNPATSYLGASPLVALVYSPGPDFGLHPVPKPDVEWRRTDFGLPVSVARQGGACWDAPVPCTPYFDPALRTFRPNEIRSGFSLGPHSQPERSY